MAIFFSLLLVFPSFFTVVLADLLSLLITTSMFFYFSPHLYSSLTQVSCMGGMQEFFFVELVREGAVMAILAGHEGKEKLVFLSPNVFILPLK
jgi:hypothetical protein